MTTQTTSKTQGETLIRHLEDFDTSSGRILERAIFNFRPITRFVNSSRAKFCRDLVKKHHSSRGTRCSFIMYCEKPRWAQGRMDPLRPQRHLDCRQNRHNEKCPNRSFARKQPYMEFAYSRCAKVGCGSLHVPNQYCKGQDQNGTLDCGR